ncbi:intramembrane serine protease GlpG [Posidoniimonas corsicana]|uniref:Intramembrane serine protease GlpG n=1 Tax=Posidoniimonas corsicana TaxID=1938618 RepID=A0A5C5VBP1_9BACT|nr:rhombosortase [Posidoniimonas corsicana]TWT35430.1 intramembrane serine protease GlpG [Posidoniimonas corsicana]
MITAALARHRSWLAAVADAPVTCAVAAAAVLATLAPGLAAALEFDRELIAQGELWRVLTGHLTHWNRDHLFWDLGVFGVLGACCERRGRAAFAGCVAASAVLISVLMQSALPEIPLYRGLSGIDTALFALLGVGLYRDARRRDDFPLQAAGLLAKIVFEITTCSTLFVDHSGASFIPLAGAHVLGALVGLAAGLISPTATAASASFSTRCNVGSNSDRRDP